MSVTFTPQELALINHALSFYQHNNSFRGVSAEVDALITKHKPDQAKDAPFQQNFIGERRKSALMNVQVTPD